MVSWTFINACIAFDLFSYLKTVKFQKNVLNIKQVFHSSLQIFFKIFFTPINNYQLTREIHMEMNVGLEVK
jgi:hypothetical protein